MHTRAEHAIRAAHDVERIGRPGEMWGRRYTDGWSLFGNRSGLIARGLTRAEIDRDLARYEQARTHDKETAHA